MLRIVNKLHNLSFGKLMGVYAEGNRENARESYPQLPLEQGILEAEQDFYLAEMRGNINVSFRKNA